MRGTSATTSSGPLTRMATATSTSESFFLQLTSLQVEQQRRSWAGHSGKNTSYWHRICIELISIWTWKPCLAWVYWFGLRNDIRKIVDCIWSLLMQFISKANNRKWSDLQINDRWEFSKIFPGFSFYKTPFLWKRIHWPDLFLGIINEWESPCFQIQVFPGRWLSFFLSYFSQLAGSF